MSFVAIERVGASLRETQHRLADAEEVEVAFMAGSLVDGFGNTRSDLDLYLIASDEAMAAGRFADWLSDVPEEGLHPGVRIDTGWSFDGTRIDVETWTPQAVRSVAVALNGEARESRGISFSEIELELAHSVRSGWPIPRFEAALDRLSAEFDWNRLAWIVRSRALVQYHAFFEDAVGAIEVGDHVLALYTSREALAGASHALAASLGSTHPKRRWRLHLLRALGEEDTAEAIVRAECDLSPVPSAILEAAECRLRLASRLAQQVQSEA